MTSWGSIIRWSPRGVDQGFAIRRAGRVPKPCFGAVLGSGNSPGAIVAMSPRTRLWVTSTVSSGDGTSIIISARQLEPLLRQAGPVHGRTHGVAALQTAWTEWARAWHEVHRHVRQPRRVDPAGRKRSVRAERKPSVKGVGEPSDRKGHARIDEEEWEPCVTPARAGGCKPPTEVDRLYPSSAGLRGAPTLHSTAASDHQRGPRSGERDHSVGEEDCAGLPERRALQDRHLLPLWRAGSLPTRNPVEP